MWKLVLLRVLYYMFFALIFILALFIFLRIVNFYFYLSWMKEFLENFVNRINF